MGNNMLGVSLKVSQKIKVLEKSGEAISVVITSSPTQIFLKFLKNFLGHL